MYFKMNTEGKEKGMAFVHESIHRMSKTDVLTMEHRLSTVTRPDPNAPSGQYTVYCLYFDKDRDFALMDSSTGAYKREEYRICYYNNRPDLLILSKKSELNGLSSIETCEVTRDFVEAILYNRYSEIVSDPMGRTGDNVDPLLQEFYWEVIGNGLRPKVLLDYETRIHLYAKNEAQITINYNLRSSGNLKEFFNPFHATVPVRDDSALVHIKWKNFLPDVISRAVTMTRYTSNVYSYIM